MQYAVGDAPAVVEAQNGGRVSRQRGATLVEIVLYLAVAAIVIFAVFSLFGSAFGSSKNQTETQNLQGLVGSVNNMYGTTKDFPAGNMVPTLISAKAVPSTMVAPGVTDALRNAWAGAVRLDGQGTFYTLRYEGVPRRACIELARTPTSAFRASVNGTLYVPSSLETEMATRLCGSDEANNLVWDLR